MLLVAAYYLPEAAYPSLVPCSASLSFAPDISFPCFCVSQDSLALKLQLTLLHITAVFFLFLTLSVLGGLFQFRQPLTQLYIELTDAHSPLTPDIGVLAP